MKERKKKKKNGGEAQIDETEAQKEGASPGELREINEAQGDGGNPQWWKNEDSGKSEVH